MSEDTEANIERIFEALTLNQNLIQTESIEQDFLTLLKIYKEQRKILKQVQYQLKCVTLKTKSQSQQIQDQRERRLLETRRANRLHRTIQQIYDTISYRSSSVEQFSYIKKLCEDRLRKEKISSDDEDEIDSHNCTIDEEHNDSIVLHPRVVLPKSTGRKRRITELNGRNSISVDFSDPIGVSHHDWQRRTSPSTTIDTTKNQSISSNEQTLNNNHRFISKKFFRPETCFVCLKRIHFGSMAYRCSFCSQSSHVMCRENAKMPCRLSTESVACSPRKQIVAVFKTSHRQQPIHSEPRKTATLQSSNLSTIQQIGRAHV